MAVLIEGLSVIVRRWDVNRRFPGGLRSYRALCTNGTFCTDGQLVRVGFLSTDAALIFMAGLQDVGFVGVSDGMSIDSCLVDQRHGMAYRATWLEVFRFPYQGGSLTLAALAGDDSPRVAVPKGWQFEGSPSARVSGRDTGALQVRHSA